MKIHITQTTKSFLKLSKFETIERGILEVSDKTLLKTYSVVGKFNKSGTVDMFPYKDEVENIEYLQKSPKWEGFKLVNKI